MEPRKANIVAAGFNQELCRALTPVKTTVDLMTGASTTELKGLPNNTSSSALFAKINEIVARLNASGGYKTQGDTATAPLSDAGVQPEDLKFLPLTGGTLTGAVTGTEFTATTFTGSLSGNATSATKDGAGNVIASTYLPLGGGTMTGALSVKSPLFVHAVNSSREGGEIVLNTPSSSYCDSVIDNNSNCTRIFSYTSGADAMLEINHVTGSLKWNGSEIRFVKETCISGASWYRKWSDGWIEQGGTVTGSGSASAMSVTFLTPFSDSGYTSVIAQYGNPDTWSTNISSKSATGITFNVVYNAVSWYACGC